MKIGVRVFPDNVEEMSKFDVDYFEAAVRIGTDLEVYNSIKERIEGIHGAILSHEVNFMNKIYNSINNSVAIEKTLKATNKLSECKYIIFHPGYVGGELEESCSLGNLKFLMREYPNPLINLETVPVFAYPERYVFPIHSVEDYKSLKEKTGKNIMLDLGHAMITSRAMKYDPVEYMSNLIEELDIKIVHVADNDDRKDGYEDSHLHIGEGNVPIEQILKKYKDKIEYATLEVNGVTPKDIKTVRSYIS